MMPQAAFIMIDGLRPDAIAADRCPTLMGLIERSAYTLQARSVMPSITLPCHTSIFHSVPPTRHGVTTNDWQPMARPLPGLIEQAHAAGLKCAFFHNWEQLRDLSRPGKLAYTYFRDNETVKDLESGDQIIAEEAVRYLKSDQPDFAFIYFGTVDTAGHRFGWMTDGYLTQVARVDQSVKTVLEALTPETTVLIQADHGGHDRGHGTDSVEDMTIPWLIAGPGIRRGYQLEGPVSLLDTAPTLAQVLGIKAHADWEGRVIEEAFTG
jgi:predicted AlkP superfamily pyrophosphatase or phosphodiesterase